MLGLFSFIPREVHSSPLLLGCALWSRRMTLAGVRSNHSWLHVQQTLTEASSRGRSKHAQAEPQPLSLGCTPKPPSHFQSRAAVCPTKGSSSNCACSTAGSTRSTSPPGRHSPRPPQPLPSGTQTAQGLRERGGSCPSLSQIRCRGLTLHCPWLSVSHHRRHRRKPCFRKQHGAQKAVGHKWAEGLRPQNSNR